MTSTQRLVEASRQGELDGAFGRARQMVDPAYQRDYDFGYAWAVVGSRVEAMSTEERRRLAPQIAEGHDAARDGCHFDAPYPLDSPEWTAWTWGYVASRMG